MYVLDTNTVIYFFKEMGQVKAKIRTIDPKEIALPTVVLYELYVGLEKSKNSQSRRKALQILSSKSTIIPFDQKAAKAAGQVRARLESMGQPIGPIDTLIAGMAIAQDATLITHNVKEFSRVEGLLVEDWY
ncbi:MAG: type II toxin-antitoxin system VapC family toxin [Cyanobacteria bacterium P01_D01_bin.156]